MKTRFPKVRKGEPHFIPSWLADPNSVAPCICGRPQFVEPTMIATGEYGMKRWLHLSCFAMIEDAYDWDDYDWDDEEDEDD